MIQFLKSIVLSVGELGVDAAPLELKKKIRATNYIVVILILCAFLVGFSLLVLNLRLMGGIAIAMSVLYCITLIFNRLNFTSASRVYLIVVLNFAIYCFSTSLGQYSETHLWFISSALISFAILNLKETRYLLICICLSAGSMLFVSATNFQYSLFPIEEIDSGSTRIIGLIMSYLSFAFDISIVFFVSISNQYRIDFLVKELEESNFSTVVKFGTVVEHYSDHSMIMLDASGFISSWSAGAQLILGYEASEVIGRHYSTFFTSVDIAAGLPSILLATANEHSRFIGEGWRVRKSGEHFRASVSVSRILNSSDEVVGYEKTVADLSEAKVKTDRENLAIIIEKSIREATDEFEVTHQVLVAVTQYLKVNFAVFWKINENESRLEYGSSFSVQMPNLIDLPEKLRRVSFGLGQGIPGNTWKSEVMCWHESGDEVKNSPLFALIGSDNLAACFCVPIVSNEGFFGCLQFFADDKLKIEPKIVDVFNDFKARMAQQLQFFIARSQNEQQHQLLQAIINGYPGTFRVQRLDGCISNVNSEFLKLHKVTKEQVIGKTMLQVYPDAENESEGEFKVFVENEKSVSSEKYFVFEGTKKVFLSNKFPLFDRDQEVFGVCTIGIDISDRRIAESKLQDSERRLTFALEGTHDGVWDWDLANGQMLFSEKFAANIGLSQQMPLANIEGMQGLIHSDDWEPLRNSLETHLAGDSTSLESEVRIVGMAGAMHWVLIRGKVSEKDTVGKPIRLTGVLIKIEQIKKFQDELKFAHQQLIEEKRNAEALLNALNNSAIVAVTDARGRILSINDRFCKISGYDRKELIGNDHRILNSKQLPNSFFEDMWKTIKSGQVWRGEIINRKKTGELNWLASTIVPKLDELENIVEYIAIGFDITEQKEIENQLLLINRELESALQTSEILKARQVVALEHSDIGVWEWDIQHNKLYWDEQMFRIYGVDKEKFSSAYEAWVNGLHPDDSAKTQEIVRLAVEENQSYEPYFRVLKPNGDIAHVLGRGKVIRSADGKPLKMVGTNWDISKIKDTEASLIKAQAESMQALESKALFLANMSHEIRTPLNAILGMSDLLLETQLDNEQMRYARIVHSSGNHLLRLINDILDHSKIEAGKLELEIIDFDLVQLIESHADLLVARAREKKLAFVTYIDPALPINIKGDPARIGQILLNFISNAIKFTSAGTIVIRADSVAGADNSTSDVLIRMSVRDNGIGIDKEAQERLFQPFNQADNSTSRKFGGTGLGLSISKNLVTMMNGVIGVDSVPGKGSDFWFECEFPLSQASKASHYDLPSKDHLAGKKPRIMVVDDDEIFVEIVTKYFKNWNIDTISADNAVSSLQLLESAKLDGESIDLVLIDRKMPEMDGFELGRVIKASPQLSHLPMILASSLDRHSQAAEALSLGFAACLEKPLKQSELYNAITAVMRSTSVDTLNLAMEIPTTVLNLDAPIPKRHERILVAEDVDVNQILISRYLEKLGYNFQIVADGQAVLDTIGTSRFDLILMDCQMPVMDGFESTKRIRQMEIETGHHIVIIALTANAMKEDEARCRAAGMDDFLAKPLKRDKLAAKLEIWL